MKASLVAFDCWLVVKGGASGRGDERSVKVALYKARVRSVRYKLYYYKIKSMGYHVKYRLAVNWISL